MPHRGVDGADRQPFVEPGRGIGGEGRGLLVSAVDEPQAGASARFVKGVHPIAGEGRHEPDATIQETANEQISACHGLLPRFRSMEEIGFTSFSTITSHRLGGVK
jgi:hypothetical protein